MQLHTCLFRFQSKIATTKIQFIKNKIEFMCFFFRISIDSNLFFIFFFDNLINVIWISKETKTIRLCIHILHCVLKSIPYPLLSFLCLFCVASSLSYIFRLHSIYFYTKLKFFNSSVVTDLHNFILCVSYIIVVILIFFSLLLFFSFSSVPLFSSCFVNAMHIHIASYSWRQRWWHIWDILSLIMYSSSYVHTDIFFSACTSLWKLDGNHIWWWNMEWIAGWSGFVCGDDVDLNSVFFV